MSALKSGSSGGSFSSIIRRYVSDPSIRYALIVFTASRLFLTVWAMIILAFRPQPQQPDEVLRPYLGQPRITQGAVGAILGPWQRFDTLHYMRIAETGYEAEEDSVFPPLYPALVAGTGWLLSPILPQAERNLMAAMIISNVAFFGVLVLLYRITDREFQKDSAKRSVIFLAIFPTSFFLLAAYSESLFLLFAIGSILSARKGSFWLAGSLALLASFTRLTGVILILPLAYEYLNQRQFKISKMDWSSLAVFLPLLGIGGFMIWRYMVGLPHLSEIYENYWYQTTGFPGADLIRALIMMVQGKAAFTLLFDFFCALLLIGTTIVAFRKLGSTYGLYSAGLLLFILLPTSELKPLYSFSRYALAFFPTFMIMSRFAKTPWRTRAVVYPSIALLLYFSGQFFMWGWVA
jgi:hypothetical protein